MADYLDNKDTQSMFRIIHENHDFAMIGNYIVARYNINIDPIFAKKIAERLIKQDGYTKEEILQGLADRRIETRLNLKRFQENSVVQEDEPVKDVLLKTVKEKINPKFFAKVLLLIMSMVMLYGLVIKPVYNELKEDSYIRQTIGMIAAEPGSYEEIHKQSIVAQNAYNPEVLDKHGNYVVQFDETGHPYVAYHNDGIAKDILKVCTKDPELFDLCMYNVYFDMSYNKLKNMDEVVEYLKAYTTHDESLAFVQDKLSDCEVFLDYLVAKGFISPNDKDYYEILKDINEYKEHRGTTVPFNNLSEESQKRIQSLINEYRKNKDNLYDNYKDNLMEVAGDDYGSRS